MPASVEGRRGEEGREIKEGGRKLLNIKSSFADARSLLYWREGGREGGREERKGREWEGREEGEKGRGRSFKMAEREKL